MIDLKPLCSENVHPFYKWINDEEVIRYSLSYFSKIKTEEEIKVWFLNMLNEKKSLNLGIFIKNSNDLIGYAGISKISEMNKSGEYFIFIGEKQHWGKGIGTEVTKEVIEIGFNKLDLNRIMLTVSELNIGGIKAYERVGFIIEGRLRQACLRSGGFHDKIVMSILKHEWNSQNNKNQPITRGVTNLG